MHVIGCGEDALAGRRQAQAAAETVEDRHAQGLLKLLNLLGNPGSCQVQAAARLGHRAALGHGLQDLELAQAQVAGIHKLSLSNINKH